MVDGELPFGERTSQLLMMTAKHPAISNPNHGSLLPSSWQTLAVLAQLPERQFLKQLKAGAIHPEMERSDAQALVRVLTQAAVNRAVGFSFVAGGGVETKKSFISNNIPNSSAGVGACESRTTVRICLPRKGGPGKSVKWCNAFRPSAPQGKTGLPWRSVSTWIDEPHGKRTM